MLQHGRNSAMATVTRPRDLASLRWEVKALIDDGYRSRRDAGFSAATAFAMGEGLQALVF
jgi:hypothetical protein